MRFPSFTVFVLSWVSASCAHLGSIFDPPKVTLQHVDVTELSFSGIATKFVFSVENPNPLGVDLVVGDQWCCVVVLLVFVVEGLGGLLAVLPQLTVQQSRRPSSSRVCWRWGRCAAPQKHV